MAARFGSFPLTRSLLAAGFCAGFYAVIVFLTLGVACALFYLAELIEEYTNQSRRILLLGCKVRAAEGGRWALKAAFFFRQENKRICVVDWWIGGERNGQREEKGRWHAGVVGATSHWSTQCPLREGAAGARGEMWRDG